MAGGGDPLDAALALFRAGRGREAYEALAPAMAAGLDDPNAHQLMGLILHSLGDLAGCERALRTVVRLKPVDELATQTLVRMLASQGRDDEAVEVWRALASAAPDYPGPAFGLAAALYTVGREAEAEAACRDAIAKGMDRIEPWLFLGRLLNLQSRLEEAEGAYREAVANDPLSEDAQRELAQLIWMRTADVAKARALLDAAPQTAALTALTVKLLQDAGEPAAAYALAAERAERDLSLQLLAARAALRVDPLACDRHLARVPQWVNPRAKASSKGSPPPAISAGAAAGRMARDRDSRAGPSGSGCRASGTDRPDGSGGRAGGRAPAPGPPDRPPETTNPAGPRCGRSSPGGRSRRDGGRGRRRPFARRRP